MRAKLSIGLTAALLDAGCDDSPTTQPQRPIVVRSEAQDALHQLSDLNLKTALRRAIYDSGAACQTVTEAGYVPRSGIVSASAPADLRRMTTPPGIQADAARRSSPAENPNSRNVWATRSLSTGVFV